jgi:hypothetical protein
LRIRGEIGIIQLQKRHGSSSIKGGKSMAAERAAGAVKSIETYPTEPEQTDQQRLAADLQHLRDLLTAADVPEARRFVKELEERWPEAERVRHYAHVLQPPKVRMRPDIPARSSEREWKWLEEHGREYPGCWLAIYEDQLIAFGPDRQVVTAQAEQVLGEETYLIFHQPESAPAK